MTNNTEVAQTILSQISLGTKMACGSRNYIAIENGLAFNVLTGNRDIISITLEPSDTYTVKRVKVAAKTKIWQTVEEVSDVYCDNLSEVIYGMVIK
jgi:hypothetical protein